MEKIELAKEFADMVKQHEQEALAMVTKISSSEMTDDLKDVLYKVMVYSTDIAYKSKRAQYYYADLAEELIKTEE